MRKKVTKRVSQVAAMAMAAVLMVGEVGMAPVTVSAAATTNQISEREQRNAQLSKEAATEGMVLLENEDKTLPVVDGTRVAVFGGGSYATMKGGTGSGDVKQVRL